MKSFVVRFGRRINQVIAKEAINAIYCNAIFFHDTVAFNGLQNYSGSSELQSKGLGFLTSTEGVIVI